MRMRIGQIIWRVSVVVVVLGGMIAALVAVHKRTEPTLCRAWEVVIVDSVERKNVSVEELQALLKRKQLCPLNREISSLSLQQIEEVMEAHDMLRTAQCYSTPKGLVRIEVTQRQPLFQVVTQNETYFVDADHTVLPYRETVKSDGLRVTGQLTHEMACGPIAEVVEWINGSSYWADKIEAVVVSGPNAIRLKQSNGLTLVLGGPEQLAQKMHKIQTFYQKAGFPTDSVPYRELDARYHGQVVGRK